MWVGLGLEGESSLFLSFLLPPKDIARKVPFGKQKTKPPLDIEPARHFPESRTMRERETSVFLLFIDYSVVARQERHMGCSPWDTTLAYEAITANPEMEVQSSKKRPWRPKRPPEPPSLVQSSTEAHKSWLSPLCVLNEPLSFLATVFRNTDVPFAPCKANINLQSHLGKI